MAPEATVTTVDPAAPQQAASLYERRWQRLWEELEHEGVGALAVYGRGSLGSYGPLHYLTGCFAGPKGAYALIAPGRPPVLVAGSELEAGLLRAGVRAEGVEVARGPRSGAAASTGALLAAAAGSAATALAAPPGGLPAAELERLRAAAGAGPRDLSPLLDEQRAALEPEDETLLAGAVADAEAAIARFAAGFKVGISEREAAAEIDAELSRRGALTRMVFVSAESFCGRPPGDRVICPRQPVTVLVELASPSGHWAEIGVIAAAGGLTAEARRAADACVDALRAGAGALRPGARCAAPAAAMEATLRERGGRPVSGLGHGTGVDEKGPVIAAAAEDEVRAGTAFALHPSYAPLSGAAAPATTVANTFLVATDPARAAAGARALSELPYTLLELAS